MQQQKLAVFTNSTELYNRLKKCIPPVVSEVQQIERSAADAPLAVTMAFVDGKWEGDLRALIDKLAAQAIYTVLVDDEKHIGDDVPALLAEGLVDDLLLTPIRPVEVLGKVKHAAYLARINEVVAVNKSIKALIEKFEEDIRTTRAIQRSLIPEKFTPVQGFKVAHKYLSGLRSGGDYLDFFEFEDKTHVGILMSDSSGYGLSSAFMSVILRLAVKLSKDEVRRPSATVAKIFEELELTMKPKENLSIFYGILNRKTFELNYASAGHIRFIHQSREANQFSDFSSVSEPLAKGQKPALSDQKLQLLPNDRIVVLSDGFGDLFDGAKAMERTFKKVADDDAIELINDMVYRVKNKFEAEDDMPEQDCSVMVIDVEKRSLRLAK